MAFAQLNGHLCKSASVIIPTLGCWTIDCVLDRGVSIDSEAVTFVLAGLTMQGTIFRSGNFVGSSSFRIVGGKGGWKKVISSKFYQSVFGVKLRPVLTDAAREAGESIVVETDRTIGQFFTRRMGSASIALWQLASSWYVDMAGVTQVRERDTPIITSKFDLLADGTHLNLGMVQIATDRPEDWQPGVKFSSPTLTQKQASAIVHKLDGDKLRTEVVTL